MDSMTAATIMSFKKKLNGRAVFGPFSKISDPAVIEVMGYAGFDFVIIDLEHGPNSVQTVQNLVRAAEVANLFPIVRVKENLFSVIGEVLDIGAGGIQVPQIISARKAQEAISCAKFAPLGNRGVCRFVRAANYSAMDRYKYFKEANEAIVILQLEGTEAINNLEQILDVQGIDLVFIGPYDLSQSLGLTGQVSHPDVEEKMTQIIKCCADKSIQVGTFVDTLEDAQKWIKAGVQYISYSVDVGIFCQGCCDIVKKLKQNL